MQFSRDGKELGRISLPRDADVVADGFGGRYGWDSKYAYPELCRLFERRGSQIRRDGKIATTHPRDDKRR